MRRLRRTWLRGILPKDGRVLAGASLMLVLAVLTGFGMAYRQHMVSKIDTTDFTPLLNTIAKGESNGNYNAYFGNASNTSIRFTGMTVAEVQQWQENYLKQGHASTAVGKYQIINTTLNGLLKQLEIAPEAVFNEELQDRMAVALLTRRGAADYLDNKMTREEFAANLAKEWAALPKVIGDNPEQSYYAGDGLNKVRISIDEVFTALATIQGGPNGQTARQ